MSGFFHELLKERLAQTFRGTLPAEEYVRSLVGDNITVINDNQEVVGTLQRVDDENFCVGEVIFKPAQVVTFVYGLFGAPTFVLSTV